MLEIADNVTCKTSVDEVGRVDDAGEKDSSHQSIGIIVTIAIVSTMRHANYILDDPPDSSHDSSKANVPS